MFHRQLPPLNAIKAFDAVVRFGSLSKAAKMLVVSQSAVSRHIRNLELFLDCQLIERNRNGVILTSDGRNFHEKTSEALSLILEATTSLRSKQSGMQILKVSSLSSFALRWLVPRLPDFQTLHPGIVIDISISDDKPDFRQSDRDGAIISENTDKRDVSGNPLFSERLTVVCAPSLLEVQGIHTYEDVFSHSIIHVSSRGGLWGKWAASYGVEGESETVIGLAVQDFYIAIAAAKSGSGVALVPSILIEDELRAGTLIEPISAPLTTGRQYQLVLAPEKRNDLAACAFRDWLVKETSASLL